MSQPNIPNIYISRTPGLENPVWVEQTIHNKETGVPEIYLFQRDAAKTSPITKIKDFFKGKKLASDVVGSYLGGKLSFFKTSFSNIKSHEVNINNPEVFRKDEREKIDNAIKAVEDPLREMTDSLFFSVDQYGSKNIDSARKIHVDSQRSITSKASWGNTVERHFDQNKLKFWETTDQHQIKKSINYCIDLAENRAPPKSKNELGSMMTHLERFIKMVPKEAENMKAINSLNLMFEQLLNQLEKKFSTE